MSEIAERHGQLDPGNDGTLRLSIAFAAAVVLHCALLIPFLSGADITLSAAGPMVVDLEAEAIDTGTSTGDSSPAAVAVQAPGSGTTGAESDFVIPTPRAASQEQAAAKNAQAFREEGGRTGVTAPLEAPVMQPKPQQEPAASNRSAASAPPAKGQGVLVQEQSPSGGSLDLGSLDKALSGKGSGSGTVSGSGSGSGSGVSSGSGSAVDSGSGAGIQWDRPAAAKNRKPLFSLNPKIPSWVGTQGLTLTVTVSFTVSAEGTVSSPKVEKSCGYADVDAAVLEAVRFWRFTADATAPPLLGILPYMIRVR
jgi:TonB family protein